jgi:lysophospholipase L1-like esterase
VSPPNVHTDSIAAPQQVGTPSPGEIAVGRRTRIGGVIVAALLDGRLVLLVAWGFLGVAVSGLLLCLVPVYPILTSISDRGGGMGIPNLAERLASDHHLHTWPFREYAIEPGTRSEIAVELQVVIGDYMILLRGAPDDRRVGIRVSSDPRIPSALIRYDGDRAIGIEPITLPLVSRTRSHRIGASLDAGSIVFSIDGQQVAAAPVSAHESGWYVAAGIRQSVILEVGTGRSPSEIDRLDPWSIKRGYLIGLSAVVLLMCPVVFAGVSARVRWICAVVLTAAALPIAYTSPYLIFTLLLLPFAALGVLGALWLSVLIRCLQRRPARAAAMRALTVSALAACWLGFFAVMAIANFQPRPLEPDGHGVPGDGIVRPPSAIDPGARRVLVFGASGVLGEGLTAPERERFAAQLVGPGSVPIAVEVWARGGALMKDVLAMQEEALRRPADVVILYMTFNDAINPADASLWDALTGMNGFGMIGAFYDSASWMADHFARTGPLYEDKVSTFVTRAQRAGARVILVAEPSADYVTYRDGAHGISRFHSVLQRTASAQGAAYIDIPRELFNARDDFLFVDSVHLNRHGHRILSEHLNAALAASLQP